MGKLLKWDLLSLAFVSALIVFGTSVVFLTILDLSTKAKLIFMVFAIASFFSCLSMILQLNEKRRREDDKT